MPDANAPLRSGDLAVSLPGATDTALYFIGRVRTPYARLEECPKSGNGRDTVAMIELDPRWQPALKDLELFSHVVVLYWFEHSRRDLALQTPGGVTEPRGTFSIRSPARPNPIGMHVSELISVAGPVIKIRGIDCLDGTPVIDIKPYYPSLDAIPDAKTPSRPATPRD